MVLSLPTALPLTWQNVNWTPISIAALMLIVLTAWYLPVHGARHWYHGKSHTLAAGPAAGQAAAPKVRRTRRCYDSMLLPVRASVAAWACHAT